MRVQALVREKQEEILRICAKYRAKNVRVFASAPAAKPTSKATWTCWSSLNQTEAYSIRPAWS